MTLKKSLIIFLCTLFWQSAEGQLLISDVKLESVYQSSVRDYLSNQNTRTNRFVDIEPSLAPDEDSEGYFYQVRSYLLEDSVHQIWDHYLHTKPKEAWNSQRFRFYLLYSKTSDNLYYSDDKGEDLALGQILFLNLNLLFGWVNVAMAFEITHIDPVARVIEFSYIKGNYSEGKQRLELYESANGHTRIEHSSYYKSSSLIRDLLLYPHFHARIIDNFHRNLKRELRKKKDSSSVQ